MKNWLIPIVKCKNNRNVLTAKIAIAYNKHEHRGKKKIITKYISKNHK